VRSSKGDRVALLVLLIGVALIALLRPGLAAQEGRLRDGRDPYLLPPPEQTVVMSLGYRAAAADLIFGHVLVAAGIHLTEKRLFEFAGDYLATINALDPKFRDPYRYADAILTVQTVEVPEEMYRQARELLLRGTRELPFDQDLHLSAGQYLAYLAPQWLKDPKEGAAYKQEGARLLARACELVGSNENAPHHCVTAARLLGDAGNEAAAQAFLERFLMVVDDPELRQLAQMKLDRLRGGGEMSEQRKRYERMLELWRLDLPFVSRLEINSLGPRFEPAGCAGLARSTAEECASTFRDRLNRNHVSP
jgi:hypothetical protein